MSSAGTREQTAAKEHHTVPKNAKKEMSIPAGLMLYSNPVIAKREKKKKASGVLQPLANNDNCDVTLANNGIGELDDEVIRKKMDPSTRSLLLQTEVSY